MIFVAFAALISLVSCQKAITPVDGNEEKVVSTITSPVFTASISGATKTTVNVTDGKVAWENDDEITVTEAAAPQFASSLHTVFAGNKAE